MKKIIVVYFYKGICHIHSGDNYDKYFISEKDTIINQLNECDVIVTIQSESLEFPNSLYNQIESKLLRLDAYNYLCKTDQSIDNRLVDISIRQSKLSRPNITATDLDHLIFDIIYRAWIYASDLYKLIPTDTSHIIADCFNVKSPYYKIAYIDNYLSKAINNVRHFNGNRLKIDDKMINFLYHPNYSAMTTKLGRLKCSDKIYTDIDYRKKIYASNDNIIELDASAAELQFLVSSLNCKNYDSKIDLYKYIASIVKSNKATIKSIILPYYYGSSANNIANRIKLSSRFIEDVLTQFRELFPEVEEFYNSKDVLKDNYVLDAFGKRIHIESDKAYGWLNYYCQSSFSMQFQMFVNDLLKMVNNSNMKSNILFTIHDSVYVDIKYDELESLVGLINKCNQYSYKFKRQLLHMVE